MHLPKRLIDGYECFRSGRLPREQSRYHDLAENGQSPETMLIGCCDSRVSPDVIFDARPGELFVVRNVANLVPPFSPDDAYHGVSAALEFAVQVLRVKHIVVLGHAQCGGIKAFAERNEPLSPSDFIGKWMSMIAPAAAAIGPPSELARDLPDATGTGGDGDHARKPDDLPLRPQPSGTRRADPARRVFRCRLR